jgi:hypothetical protein
MAGLAFRLSIDLSGIWTSADPNTRGAAAF